MKITKDDKNIIVNYHYVENSNPNSTTSHPCSNEEFDKQVSFLKDNYEIVDIPILYKRAVEESPNPSCAITFDDGLKCQYKNALPILNKHKMPATFFISTGTLEGFLPSTHKIHALLSQLDGENLVAITNNFFKNKHPELVRKYLIPLDKRITEERKLRDNVSIANFKETLNILPSTIGDELLDQLLGKTSIDMEKLPGSLFMDADEIQELDRGIHTIGCHGHHHYALNSQEERSVENEIEDSFAKLSNIISNSPKIFSYPHGGENDFVIKTLKKSGFTHAVTIEQRQLTKETNPFKIPRFDTKDLTNHLDKTFR